MMLLLALLLCAAPVHAAVQISFISIGPDLERLDGNLVPLASTFELFVVGTDVSDACVTPPGAVGCIPLSSDGPGWGIDPNDPIHSVPPVVEFSTLAAMRVVYPTGNYVFRFNEQAPGVYELEVTVPQLVDPPDFLPISNPLHEETGTSRSVAFMWTCPVSGDLLRVEIQEGEEDGPSVGLLFCVTSWAPDEPLRPAVEYQFTASNFSRTGGASGQSISGITVHDEAEHLNIITFTTEGAVPAMPGVGHAILAGLLLAAAMLQLRTWSVASR